MEIRKGDIHLADLSPRVGTEAGKVRPVVVVQTDLLNNVHPSTIICPLTTNVHPQATILRVHLRPGEAGLRRRSDIMVDQIRAIDNRRLLRRLGRLSPDSQTRLRESLFLILN